MISFTQLYVFQNKYKKDGLMEDPNPTNKIDDGTQADNIKIDEAKPQSNSKLESLSREDLIKLVKRQLVSQKETKKQLEIAKREAEETGKLAKELQAKLDQIGKDGNNSMLMIELADYKNAINAVRKELQENKEQLAKKDSLVEELSQRIAQLQEDKEEANAEMKRKLAEATEMRQAIEEKSKVITENSKEINALLFQLNESRQAMQEEIGQLQAALSTQAQQLAAEQRADSTRNAELKRLRCENETLASRLATIEEDFSNYKERAEYALKSKANETKDKSSEQNEHSGSASSQDISKSGDINHLIDTLRQRNTEISQLNAKCSYLDEEVRSSQQHAKTLLDELNALHDSIGDIRRQAQLDRQRICQEYEQRLKVEVALKMELERELKIARENETKAFMVAEENEVKMRQECEKLTKELAEVQKKLNDKTTTQSSSPPQQKRMSEPKRVHQTRPNKLKMPTLNITAAIGGSSNFTTGMHHPERLSPEFNGNEEEGMNSESSDSLEDLQSMLQEAEISPTSEMPTLNVASLASGDDSPNLHHYGIHQNNVISEEQHREVQKQLTDCRELLSELEETNVRLMEQSNVLKEEIRRMERNQERVKHLDNQICSEYFKNIVLKFLAPPKVNDERTQLLPVLQTILRLDERELELVRRSCATTTPVDDGQGESSIGSTTGDTGAGNGANLMDWSSLFGWK